VPMMNPLSNDMSFLRTSLLPGLIKAADFNIKNSSNSFKLYELGNVHMQSGNKIEDIKENLRLSGIVVGNENSENIHSKITPYDLFSIKGYVHALLNDKLRLDISLEKCENILFYQSYNFLINKNIVGTMGKISNELFAALKINKHDVYAFDLDMDMILRQREIVKYSPVNFYPKISRRINLVLDTSDSVGPILELIDKKGGNILIDKYVVEVFENEENLGENKKSVTFKMLFQDSEKTLEDKDVNQMIDEIIDIVDKKFNAKLRV
jgi:Phenylalanyl-tRNA synthetase beta subunit